MQKDRDYWRCKSNADLIEAAKYEPSIELCIALAERLEEEAVPSSYEEY